MKLLKISKLLEEQVSSAKTLEFKNVFDGDVYRNMALFIIKIICQKRRTDLLEQFTRLCDA